MDNERLIEIHRQLRAKLIEEEAAAAPPPAATPPPAASAETTTTAEERPPHVAEAVERAKAHAAAVADAREYLRQSLPSRGYRSDLADELTPEEALDLAGMRQRELTPQQERAARQQAEYDRDPRAFEHRRAVEKFVGEFWQLGEDQRRQRASELGLNVEEVRAHKEAQAEQGRGYFS